MIKLRGKKDELAREFQMGLAQGEARKPSTQMSPEYMQSFGRTYWTIIDDNVLAILVDPNLDLAWLIPLLSHLNRLTRSLKDDVVLDRLEIRGQFLKVRIRMKKHKYSVELSRLLGTLEYYARHMTSDAYEGFKAELMAFQVKVLKTELEEKKTKGILGF